MKPYSAGSLYISIQEAPFKACISRQLDAVVLQLSLGSLRRTFAA
jgi:hypothetical protein